MIAQYGDENISAEQQQGDEGCAVGVLTIVVNRTCGSFKSTKQSAVALAA